MRRITHRHLYQVLFFLGGGGGGGGFGGERRIAWSAQCDLATNVF